MWVYGDRGAGVTCRGGAPHAGPWGSCAPTLRQGLGPAASWGDFWGPHWGGLCPQNHSSISGCLQNVALLEEEADINQLTEFFSYEHFYVIYCKFWELDTDHDLLIDPQDLARHNDHGERAAAGRAGGSWGRRTGSEVSASALLPGAGWGPAGAAQVCSG